MAATVQRARGAEAALVGACWDEAALAASQRALANDFTPLTDMIAPIATGSKGALRRDAAPRSAAYMAALCELVTPSHVVFPNVVTIFHPDYLSLITLYPAGPEALSWTHRMGREIAGTSILK